MQDHDAGGASLLSGDCAALTDAAGALQRAGLSLAVVGDSIVDHSFAVTETWSGAAADAAHAAITKLGNGVKVGADVAVPAAEVIRTYERALADARATYDNAQLQVDALRRDFLTGIETAPPDEAETSRELFRRFSAPHLEAMSDAVANLASASTTAAERINTLVAQLDQMSPTSQSGAGDS